jgi:hypothetical protein
MVTVNRYCGNIATNQDIIVQYFDLNVGGQINVYYYVLKA